MTESPKIITHSNEVVYLRKDLYAPLDELTKYVLDQFSAKGLCHTLSFSSESVEKRTVSEFLTAERWQEEYWDHFSNKNPVSKLVDEELSSTDTYFVACDEADPSSDCMEARKSMCKIQSSFALIKRLPNGLIENTAIMFDKKVNFSKHDMIKFWRYIRLIREAHLDYLYDPILFENIESQSKGDLRFFA